MHRREFVRAGSVATVGLLAGCLGNQQVENPDDTDSASTQDSDPGLVTVESDDDFETTLDGVRTRIEDADGLSLMTEVDHAENAAGVDEELPPTSLLIFGNPNVGTPLMQQERTVAIDLPQKMLVWEGDDGNVRVSYNDPEWLFDRHGIDDPDRQEAIRNALDGIARG